MQGSSQANENKPNYIKIEDKNKNIPGAIGNQSQLTLLKAWEYEEVFAKELKTYQNRNKASLQRDSVPKASHHR